MVDGDSDDVVGWYDINYIYRRMTPRFVDYDEVEAGKITQSFTFLLKDIINYIYCWMTPRFVDYDEVEAVYFPFSLFWMVKMAQKKSI